MRVVSLFPAATEIVAALGAESSLAGISHECDWPPSITHLPRVTWTPIDPDASSGEIDRLVRDVRGDGKPVIAVDAEALRTLAPDLILTQGLCDVCAVADGEVHRLADALESMPEVLSLSASDVAGIMDDIRAVAARLDLSDAGDELVVGLEYRLRELGRTAPPTRPRVVCVEWLDPIFLAGHWVPELVTAAGGTDIGAAPGSHSIPISVADYKALAPDLVIVMLCGFGIDRAKQELEGSPLPDLGAPIAFIDGNAYTSRPGPRIADGARKIQESFRASVRNPASSPASWPTIAG